MQTKQNPFIIYHDPCLDGFGAAFAAWLIYGDSATYHPTTYGCPPPDVTGKDVVIVDFSYPPEQVRAMEQQANTLVLLDHHKTSAKDFHGYKCMCGNKVHFDMEKSGARLAWEYFHPGKCIPPLINLIEDRDLWNWKYEDTKFFNAALQNTPKDFHVWKGILEFSSHDYKDFIKQGRAQSGQWDTLCQTLLRHAMPVEIDGIAGLMLNAPYEFATDLGNLLSKQSGTFGLIYGFEPGRIKASLRSQAPFDVSNIASRFGGGGHAQACGLSLTLEQVQQMSLTGKLCSAS